MMDEEIRQTMVEVREMKQMCGNINMKLTNIVTQRGQDWKKKLEAEYQKGINDGSLDVKQRVEGAYQKGLDEAWKAARRISVIELNGGLAGKELMKIYGTMDIHKIYDDNTASEAIEKLKAYEEKQSDKIEVGDEVNWLGDCFIVTRIFQPRNGKEQCDGIDDDGCVYHDVLIKDLEKTGRHFDIASILEEMKHD